jgi:hypothetical protein
MEPEILSCFRNGSFEVIAIGFYFDKSFEVYSPQYYWHPEGK